MCARLTPPAAPLSDEELTALFTANMRLAFFIAKKYADPDHDDAEEIAQAALLKAWELRRWFDPSRGSGDAAAGALFRWWVARRVFAVLKLRRLWRERREDRMRVQSLTGLVADPRARTPDAVAERKEIDAAVERAKAGLSAKGREAVEGRLERKKLHEIDATVSRQAVEIRYRTAAREIREELAGPFGID